MLAAAGDVVVVNVGVFGIRIVMRVVDGVAGEQVADDLQSGGVVVGDVVLEDLDVVHRQQQHARAGGDVGNARARGAEIRVVVLGHLVVEHADAAAVVQVEAGQVEDKDAAAVVRGEVVVDVGVERVLDFDAGDVLGHVAILHDDVSRLADVDAGVGRTAHDAAVDQHILAGDGINAVRAVRGLRLARPFSPHVAEDDVFGSHDFDGVAACVFDGEIFDHEVVAAGFDSLRSHVLVLEGEDRLIRALAADGDIGGRDFEIHVEIELARGKLDDVTRNGLNQETQEFCAAPPDPVAPCRPTASPAGRTPRRCGRPLAWRPGRVFLEREETVPPKPGRQRMLGPWIDTTW